MPQQPLRLHSLTSSQIHSYISLLTTNLISITDASGHFLLSLPDGRIIDTKGWNDWEWTHGIGLYGLYQYYSQTNSAETLKIITSWFSSRFKEGTTKNINTMSPFLTLAYLYEETRDQTFIPWLDSWGEWAMYELPRTRFGGMQHITYLEENYNQLWDDTLMMTVMPLIKIGKIFNRQHYIEEGKRQFLIHIQYLFDTGSGLFFHGWQFDKDAKGGLGHNFARARWARGNSWLTIAIPDVLELLDLPKDDHFHLFLVDVLNAQCEALKKLQDAKTGLWRTLLDVSEEEGSYLESSASAGFAYGMLKGIRKRYLKREEYEEVAIKAVKGVMGKIREDGELMDTSFGTGMGRDLKHYLDIERTSMPYGQAMAMMALVELLRLFI